MLAEYGTIAHYKDDMIVENNYDLFFLMKIILKMNLVLLELTWNLT